MASDPQVVRVDSVPDTERRDPEASAAASPEVAETPLEETAAAPIDSSASGPRATVEPPGAALPEQPAQVESSRPTSNGHDGVVLSEPVARPSESHPAQSREISTEAVNPAAPAAAYPPSARDKPESSPANGSEEPRLPGQPLAAPEPLQVEDEATPTATEGSSAREDVTDADVPETAVSERSGYEDLLGDYAGFTEVRAGQICRGRVVSVSAGGVVVDIGGKTEGIVPLEDFREEAGDAQVPSGEEIEVFVEDPGALGEYAVLSYRRARQSRIWNDIEQAFRSETTIEGCVIERVKGGLSVDVGVAAFLPGSQLDLRPAHDPDSFVGQTIPVRIVKLNRRRENVVVSRRVLLEEELNELRKQTLDKLTEGAIVTGTVKSVTQYGAFVDLGGIDGLIHVTDLSWGRVKNPADVVKVGDAVNVKVLKFDPARERASLSLKHLEPDPWEAIEQRYQEGQRVSGRVASLADYGAFLELEPGVEGLVHITEMSWSRRLRHPAKKFQRGDVVEAQVLRADPKQRRISLSIRRLQNDPWSSVGQRYRTGTLVTGRVRNITSYGAFVEIEEGVDGLVHVTDLSWDQRVRNPKDVLKKGQEIQAAVLRVDEENRRLSLGIKQLQPDVFETFFSSHLEEDIVVGRVTRSAAFGAFVELAPGVEGLCHNSEIPKSSGKKGKNSLKVGKQYKFRLVRLDEFDKKISLSRRGVDSEGGEPSVSEPKSPPVTPDVAPSAPDPAEEAPAAPASPS